MSASSLEKTITEIIEMAIELGYDEPNVEGYIDKETLVAMAMDAKGVDMAMKGWPKYNDGTEIQIGDFIDVYGLKSKVAWVKVTGEYTYIGVTDVDDTEELSFKYGACCWIPKKWNDDTWEKLEEDAAKASTYDYWDCCGVSCDGCPHRVKPKDRYGTHSCESAVHLDIVHRARELAKRDSGA